MQLPASTGAVAALLGVAEPAVNDLVRRRKIDPAPVVVAGRRLWEPDHILQAARLLGRDEAEVHAKLGEAAHGL